MSEPKIFLQRVGEAEQGIFIKWAAYNLKASGQPRDCPAALVDDDRGQAEGQLIEQKTARARQQSAAMASICCSPPDIDPAFWLRRSDPRKHLVDAGNVWTEPMTISPSIAAHHKILLDREFRKNLASFGSQRYPRRTRSPWRVG
jgi:hypothetical protein